MDDAVAIERMHAYLCTLDVIDENGFEKCLLPLDRVSCRGSHSIFVLEAHASSTAPQKYVRHHICLDILGHDGSGLWCVCLTWDE